MSDKLPEQLYTKWRSEQSDPTAHPSWGNVDADTRRTWEAIATVARAEMSQRFVASMHAACQQQVAAGQAVIDSSRGLIDALESWAR